MRQFLHLFFAAILLQNVGSIYSPSTTLADLYKLESFLWNNTSHNNTFVPFKEPESCTLRLPADFKKTMSIPPGPDIPLGIHVYVYKYVYIYVYHNRNDIDICIRKYI
jgi:hypothetical protein